MAKKDPNKQVAYFELEGKPYGVPLDDEATLRAFVNDPNAKQISPYEVDVLVETAKMEESPVLGRLEALGRGVVSGATVGLGQLAMDPVELAASKEAFPGAFYTGDIGTGIATSVLSMGSLGKARLGIEAAKAAGKSTLAKEVLQGARALSKVSPAGAVTQAAGAVAKAPLALQGTNPVSSAVRSITPFVVQGAAEGAAAGFGYGAADKYLENPNATAEDIMAAGIDSAGTGTLVGAAIPGGLGLAKTVGAGTVKGASKIAKSIYGAAADRYGKGFSDSLSKFIAAETPEVQEALAQELQKVIQFGQGFDDLNRRVKAVQKSAQVLREQGLEAKEIQKQLKSTIDTLKKDIKKLDTEAAKKANKKLTAQLNQAKINSKDALDAGELELVKEASVPLQEAADQFQKIRGRLGDTRSVIKGAESPSRVKQVSMIDGAINKQIDDEIAAGNIGKPYDLANDMIDAMQNSIDDFTASLNQMSKGTAIRTEVEAAVNAVEILRDKIRAKLDSGTVTAKDIKGFYLDERQLVRNLNLLPDRFLAEGVPVVEKNLRNQIIGAKNILEFFHFGRSGTKGVRVKNPVFGKAAILEDARAKALDSMNGVIRRTKQLKKGEQVQSGADGIVSFINNSTQSLDEIARVTQEIMGDSFSRKLMKSLGVAKQSAEKAREAVGAVTELRKAANEIKTLKPGLDPITPPQIPGSSAQEVISKSYDDLKDALLKSVDDFKEVTDAQKALEGNLRMAEVVSGRQAPGGVLFDAKLRRRAEAAGLPDGQLVQDENIEQLLKFRAAQSAGGIDVLDAVAAVDLLTGLPLPNSVSGAILGVNRMRGKNLGALQSISQVAQAVRKTDQNINKAADWALNAAVQGKKPSEYIRGTSVLGKILGVGIGQAYLPSEGQ